MANRSACTSVHGQEVFSQSSEHLLNHIQPDFTESNASSSHRIEPARQWSHGQIRHNRRRQRKTLSSCGLTSTLAPQTPRWMISPEDTQLDEKVLRNGRKRFCARFGMGTLIFFGLVQLFSVLSGLLIVFVPDGIHRIIDRWGRIGHTAQGLSSWPTDFTRAILPIPCHSHNDYWRRVPLYSAIEAGCTSVEADVWLFDEQLYVGHSLASLTSNRTLASLYVDPLVNILRRQNPITRFHPDGNHTHHGIFDTDPEQSLTLLIDFKTTGAALFPYVVAALEPLRSHGFLSYRNRSQMVNRPIIVVGTGNTPFNLVDSFTSNPHQDIFFDAPLEEMWEGLPDETKPHVHNAGAPVYGVDIDASMPEAAAVESASDDLGQGKSGVPDSTEAYTTDNSYYASVSFTRAIGYVLFGKLSEVQMNLIRGHIRGAHRRGLKVRYWELPFWPIGLRNHIWDVLIKEGVDILNVDDLKAAAQQDWTKRTGWWS